MSEKPPLTYASSDRIDAFEELATEFLREILELPWALMTDESALSDFHGCGLGADKLNGQHESTRDGYWDEWVVRRVCERYRIERFPVTIRMVDLFARIERAAPLQ
jgi:hypothetical protein